MVERIDNIDYQDPVEPSTQESQETTVFFTNPAEFLCREIATQLASVSQWETIFGDYIDYYKRMDYSMRSLPALRIYNNHYVKEFESWYIDGDITLDIILPANLRRQDLQQIPDTLSSALLQQFRRPTFYNNIAAKVPGLEELGKRFDVDKSLGFEWGDDYVPLTQILLNFRLDFRDWELYLEADERTKDDPWERTLGDLEQIVTDIRALNDDLDDDNPNLTIQADQEITD